MPRPTYHHGDLRRVVLETAYALARTGGADAVAVREVARRAEVSPAAIYRHFPDRDALLGAVASAARRTLALCMLDEARAVRGSRRRTRAVRRLLSVGRAYLRFGRDDPHLLAVAFLPYPPPDGIAEDPNPWEVLATALDELVSSGAMPRRRRDGAETIAWSAVHGFSVLRASGSLDAAPGARSPDDEGLLAAVVRAVGVGRSAQRPAS